jgi:predicted amidohydrolase YtcJ
MTTFVNGNVFVGTGAGDFVSAFTVERGRFVWVGDTNEAPDGERVDLGGATVLPGLLDVHTHPALMATQSDFVALLPPQVSSMASMVETLREHPALGGGPNAWVVGFGYNEDNYHDGTPTRHDMDLVSRSQPVFARRADGHTAVCNSFCLELAGVDARTPDPANGRFGRFPDGIPNGVLIEPAAIDRVLLLRQPPSDAELVRRLAEQSRRFLRLGITAVDDLYGNFVTDPLGKFRAARERGWPLKTAVFLVYGLSDLPRLSDEDRGGPVHVGGVKIFLDGAFSNRTAWVEEPYPNSHDHGLRTASDDDLRAAAAWARTNRVQMAVHVMGDRGINHLLSLFESQDPWLADRPSIRFEHSTLFTRKMTQRTVAARMKFGVVTHSVFLFGEYSSYAAALHQKQWPIAYPIKTMYETLPALALASDAPSTAWADCDDLALSLKAAVARRGPTGQDLYQEEAVSVGQCIHLYTGRAARLTTNRGVGLIQAGYDGNFIVLEDDVFALSAERLEESQVRQTWLNGEQVYGNSRSSW